MTSVSWIELALSMAMLDFLYVGSSRSFVRVGGSVFVMGLSRFGCDLNAGARHPARGQDAVFAPLWTTR